MATSSPTSVYAMVHTSTRSSYAKYDSATVSKCLKEVRMLRGKRTLSTEERIDIVHVFFALQKEALEIKKCPSAFKRTALFLGRSMETVRKVIKEWRECFV